MGLVVLMVSAFSLTVVVQGFLAVPMSYGGIWVMTV
jgi:hypothetical protein